MPKAKSTENKENKAAETKAKQETENFKLEEGKDEDDSGDDSEESENEGDDQAVSFIRSFVRLLLSCSLNNNKCCLK